MIETGTLLAGRYRIQEKIGSGGMAEVYKALDTALNRYVAVKILRSEYSSDETFVKKFRVEAQSAAGLSHPNIVSVYDVGEEDGIYFIVMELVEGITLKNYIDMKGKLEIREALNISVQIAQGLSAAHANRIIHRDIKPQNIIISRDGKVKVTDFGIARMAGSTTVTTTAAGTVSYISPEQARGGYSDEKSDIYSLGITMYEMLTGRVPFEGETNVAVALMHIQAKMTPPRELEPSIPESFNRIILKCTQKKPEWRYPSARALISDLRRVLTHPDGEYVVIPGMPAKGATIVMSQKETDDLRNVSPSEDAVSGRGGDAYHDSRIRRVPEEELPDDDEDEEDDERGGKTMMILGIIGLIALIVVVGVFVALAAGLIGGKKQAQTTDTASESVTESESQTAEQVEVPNLIGDSEEEASEKLSQLGLTMKVEKENSDDYPEGEIFKQSEKAGSRIDKGSSVTVTVSSGSESFTLDDVAGLDYNQAKDKLESLGLVVSLEFENSDAVDEDEVTRTSPAAGSQVSKGDTVIIYASKGKEIKKVTVPDLRSKDLQSAISAIESAGLVYNGKSSDYSDNYSSGQVMDQSLTAGSEVDEGTSITLVVSLGSRVHNYTATVTVKNPFGVSLTDQNGEEVVYEEGEVVIILTQDGSSQTLYDRYVEADELPGSLSAQSTSSSSGTVTEYINGIEFDSWTVSFN